MTVNKKPLLLYEPDDSPRYRPCFEMKPHKLDRRCSSCEAWSDEINACSVGVSNMCHCPARKGCIFAKPLDGILIKSQDELVDTLRQF